MDTTVRFQVYGKNADELRTSADKRLEEFGGSFHDVEMDADGYTEDGVTGTVLLWTATVTARGRVYK